MSEVNVTVNGRPYKMVCDPGEEDQLRELAEFVDKEVAILKKSFGQAGDSRLLVMASLVVADKLNDAVRRIETLQSEIEGLKDARSAAVERARTLEEQVAKSLNSAAGRLETVSGQLGGGAR